MTDRLVSSLSGGEQHLVAIARALINKPEIVMADEPTGNLDSYNTEKVMNLIVRLQKMFSLTVLIATHDYAVAKSAKRMLYIQDGKILKDAQRYE